MSKGDTQPQTLSGALSVLGGMAGFLWGGTIGVEAEDNFIGGALIGLVIGAIAGKVLGVAVSLAIRIAIIIGGILVNVLWFYARAGGSFD